MYDNYELSSLLLNKKFSLERADGILLYGKNNERILDFATGDSNCLGYNNRIIENQIIKQLNKGVFSQPNCFGNKQKNELKTKLCKLAGFSYTETSKECKVLFSNTSSEANENAIKIVRNRYNKLCERSYSEIICLKNSNHGNSIATISASEKKNIHYAPLLRGFKFANINDIDSIEKLITEHTSAVMIEVVQTKNNITICNEEFLTKLRELCKYHKIGLIFDETKCGNGITGNYFSYHRYKTTKDIKPDIITAKNCLSGFSLSYCIVNDNFSHFVPNKLLYQDNCNILPYNISNTIINAISSNAFLEQVRKKEKFFNNKLKSIHNKYEGIIKSVSNIGLIAEIKLREHINGKKVHELLFYNGLFCRLSNNNIILYPPLITTQNDIEKTCNIISNTLEQVSIIEGY